MSESKKELVWSAFSDDGGPVAIVIDERARLKDKGATLVAQSGTYVVEKKGWWKKTYYHPLVVLPVSERFTPDEHKARAQVICDALNADWVKKQLAGEEE